MDIRKFPEMERDFRVIEAFEAIKQHCSFLVVTDREPVTLRKEFDGELKGRFKWETIEAGPSVWKIQITKMN
jgi:uncharacterized protein (DUF2249 family)